MLYDLWVMRIRISRNNKKQLLLYRPSSVTSKQLLLRPYNNAGMQVSATDKQFHGSSDTYVSVRILVTNIIKRLNVVTVYVLRSCVSFSTWLWGR